MGTTHTTATPPRNARAAWQALSENARADLRKGVRTAAVERGLLDAGVPLEELREVAGVLAAQARLLDDTVDTAERIGLYVRKSKAQASPRTGPQHARSLFDGRGPLGTYFARRDLGLDALSRGGQTETPLVPAIEGLALALQGVDRGAGERGLGTELDELTRVVVRRASVDQPHEGPKVLVEGMARMAEMLAAVLKIGGSQRGSTAALMLTYHGLPRARREELVGYSAEALASRPLLDVVLAVLAQTERAITAASSNSGRAHIDTVFGGAMPPAARDTAARLGFGAVTTSDPAHVDDSRFTAGYDFAFERGHVRTHANGTVLAASFRPHGSNAPLEIPGDLLPLWNGSTLALPEGAALPHVAAPGARLSSTEVAVNGLVKVARNLGARGFDYSTEAIARGRALLEQAWMVKDGRLDPGDAHIVPLKPAPGEPQRFLYRTRDGNAWRPVPDVAHPVPYYGHAYLGADGNLLPDAAMPPFARTFSARLAQAMRVNDPRVVGISGPGESLPVTVEAGIPEARDLVYYTHTPDGTVLALLCKRGDNGAFATFGGFVDPDELVAIDKARAALARTPRGEFPAWPRAIREYEHAMCVPGLRETMEEGFGGENFLKHGPGRRLSSVYEAALVAGTIERTSIGRVDGDFRRSEFGAVQTDFIALELPLDLFRELERYTAGSDDAKFAGAIALVEKGQVGAFVNPLDMPYHHTMVRALAERLIAPAT